MKSWLKGGLIGAIVAFVIYIILVIINFTSSAYWCEPSGITRMSDWLYPPKYILTNYSRCGLTIIDTIIPAIVWIVVGFIIGALIGLLVYKMKSKK